MTSSAHPSRWLVLILAGLLGLGTWASPLGAAEAPVAGAALAPPNTPALFAGSFVNYVTGNRARMIQFTFIGFAIGVVILMTATRKH